MNINWMNGFEASGLVAFSVGAIASAVWMVESESKKIRIISGITCAVLLVVGAFFIGATA